MCQFCGVDPAFASFFESNNSETKAPHPSGDGPNYFRLKPDHPRYTKLTTPQLDTFASKLSTQAAVLTSSHPDFQNASQRWSNQAVKIALAIVKPATPEDVSKTIILATSHGIPFVVKCGGHSPSGASSVENGLVIDLGLMRNVSVKPEEHQVIADGGCLYGDVCKAAAEYGLACVGGSTSHVGVGGLTLSGGYGYLSGEYGLATDNIIAAQVVTSEGQILWVNEKEHADLFWGIRGAGNRLAVVTKLVLAAHRVSTVWGGVLQFSNKDTDKVITALNQWYARKNVKAAAGLVLGKVSDGTHGLTLLPFYNGSESDAMASFGSLLDLPHLQCDVSTMPFWKINTLCDQPGSLSGAHIEFDSANIRPPLHADHIHTVLRTIDQAPGSAGAYILLIQPDGIVKTSAQSTAYPWRDDHFDVGISIAWQDPDHAEKAKQWLHKVLQPVANAQGQQERLYSNHSDFNGPGAHQFGPNYDKVVALKAQWDKNNVFKSVL